MNFLLAVTTTFSLLFSFATLSMEPTLLAKRNLNEGGFEKPKRKRSRAFEQHAIENLENIARANINFEGELREYLLTHTSTCDEEGNTLTHYAVLYHNHDLLKDILNNNDSSSNRPNKEGLTPLEYAAQADNENAVLLLVGKNPTFSHAFNSLKIAHIVNNNLITHTLKKYLYSANIKTTCCSLLRDQTIKKISINDIETVSSLFMLNQLKEFEKIFTEKDLLVNLEDPLIQHKLDENWQDNFDDDLKTLIESIKYPEYFSWFFGVIAEQEQENYLIIIIELFFGSTIADHAWRALHQSTYHHDLLPYLERIPALSVKLIINDFKKGDLFNLQTIFDNTPFWFINHNAIKRQGLLATLNNKNLPNYDQRITNLFIDKNRFNINQKMFHDNEYSMLELLMYSTPNIDTFRMVLRYKANVNCRDSRGATLLMHLVQFPNKKELLEELMKHDPDLSLTDEVGHTVINAAIFSRNHNAITKLLKTVKDPHSHIYQCRQHYLEKAQAELAYREKVGKPAHEIMAWALIVEEFKKLSTLVFAP
jgi:ankyrin repeat protein